MRGEAEARAKTYQAKLEQPRGRGEDRARGPRAGRRGRARPHRERGRGEGRADEQGRRSSSWSRS